jgi:hypothetical protein
MTVTQKEWPPPEDVIDVMVPVDVFNPGTLPTY